MPAFRVIPEFVQRKSRLQLLLFTIIIVDFSSILSQRGENIGHNVNPGVFPLPEIHIKLRNGTTLQVEPNTHVELWKGLGFIELSCTADYPVKWEYLVKNKPLPVLDVVYHRLVRNVSLDFSNPKWNRFVAVTSLRGLLESQTGKYLCRQYNERAGNNSYSISSYFDIFVPGNKTFNTIPSIKFMNKTEAHVDIHCPITHSNLHVRLYKLNEKKFNSTGEIVWKPIYANYDPTEGFRLLSGLGREILGTYNCTADNGVSVISVIADSSEKDLYYFSSPSISLNSSCWEDFNFIQYIRSQRLECYCKDSYGLFKNDNMEFENRQAACSLPSLEKELEKCGDWRLEEFFRNEEESRDVCFRQRTRVQLDGSGSRPNMEVHGLTFPNGDTQRKFAFTKFNITYNGFVDWAGNFKLAICRYEVCVLRMEESRDEEDGHGEDVLLTQTHSLEFLENEPSRRQYFPLAHFQSVWNNLIVNGTDIKSVYVFQAHSLSYAWFPYATTAIKWGRVGRENEDKSTMKSGAGTSYSTTLTSSGHNLKMLIHSVIFGFIFYCFYTFIAFSYITLF